MSAPRFILGIDPGLSGALALLEVSTKKLCGVVDMPVADGRVDPYKLAAIIDQFSFQANRSIHAVVENVSSMPRQAGAFNFGRSAGVVHGALGALGISYTLIHANEWKGAMGLRKLPKETQDQNKTRARELAMKLFPNQAENFRLVKWDGRAESVLIARFFASKNSWF